MSKSEFEEEKIDGENEVIEIKEMMVKSEEIIY